jgi:hypothetical protein
LTRAYCLYKTGREVEARQVLAEMDEDESEERGVKQLEAQVVSGSRQAGGTLR